MGKMSDKEKENIILKAVEAIQESINQIQVNPDFYLGVLRSGQTVRLGKFRSLVRGNKPFFDISVIIIKYQLCIKLFIWFGFVDVFIILK